MTYGVRHAFWPSDAITNQFTELAKSLAHSAMHVQMEVADRIVDHAPKLRQLERGITSARFLPGNTKSHFRRSYTMKNQRTLLCLALCFAFATASFAPAQNLTLDDFSTGPYKKTLPTNTAASDHATTSGKMIGGSRDTFYIVCAQIPCTAAENPFGQTGTFQIRPKKAGIPSALVFSSGYKIVPDLQVFYGSNTPLALNLTPYDRLRVSFDGLTQVVNFNLQLYSNTGNGQLGCNLGPLSSLPFTEDFPLADFVPGTGTTIDLSNITRVALLTESGDYAITKFEAITPSEPPGTFTCTGQ
jgi:hypothetical protein